MIHKCKCKNDQQDKFHGEGRRVYNPTKAADTYRCTVCGAEAWVSKPNKAPAK